MGELIPTAVLDQEVPADEIGQAGAVLQPIMSRHLPAGGKFGACEEITQLLKGKHRTAGTHSSGGR